LGHKGRLTSGSVQWMTAGRGVVHSEMPGPVDTRGLQLWVNLRKEHKMVQPNYQELNPEDVKTAKQNGVLVKGNWNDLSALICSCANR
jgi:redox-sensitive bicupin YhaK (pirin superfamily)